MEYTIYVDDCIRRMYTIEADSVEEALNQCLETPYVTTDSDLEVISVWETSKLAQHDASGRIYERTEDAAFEDRIFL